MFHLKNKTVVVVGAQKSGLAVCQFAIQLGANVKLTDLAPEEKINLEVKDFVRVQEVAAEFGRHTESFVQEADLMVLSPGIELGADPVKWARAKNIPVLGEIEFAVQCCNKPIIAVTGSNGKTTTVNLIYLVLKAAGYKACLCGNVGDPFSRFAFDINQNDFVVVEVSSFQMESLLAPTSPFRVENGGAFKGFQPHVAAVLNFNPNHLDRHKDLEEYFQAKTRIFLNQTKDDFAVLNGDNGLLQELGRILPSKVISFTAGSREDGLNPNQVAVVKIAEVLGIKEEICCEVFKNFKGIEHRMEMAATIDGVDYINDSKSTTVESGQWALMSLNKPIILICGGSEKNLDYHPLKSLVKTKLKHMIVIGEIREKLKLTFEDVVSLKDGGMDFQKTIELAQSLAQPGDCVLLSPMTASFDMFKNFEHRGKVFKEIVGQLNSKCLMSNGK